MSSRLSLTASATGLRSVRRCELFLCARIQLERAPLAAVEQHDFGVCDLYQAQTTDLLPEREPLAADDRDARVGVDQYRFQHQRGRRRFGGFRAARRDVEARR